MSKEIILANFLDPGWARFMTPEMEKELSQFGELRRYSKQNGSHEEFLAAVAESDILITGWNPAEPLRAEDAGKTGKLKLHLHGAGSLRTVTAGPIIASGVRTTQGAGAIAKAVAQFTMGLIIMGLRDSLNRYLLIKEGKKSSAPFHDLEGLNVGVVSLSQVGRQVVQLLQPFGAKVLAYDPFWTAADAAALGAELVGLEEMFARADVITLHAPVLPETKGMINASLINALKPGAVFVNTARGVLVDQDALFDRCYKGELVAYLDVTTPEPLPVDHPAWNCPHIFITPHIAGVTAETLVRIRRDIIENIKLFRAGAPKLIGEVTAERFDVIA